MKQQARHFIKTWLLTSIVLATLVALFNALIDPYLLFGTPRLSGLNSHKPNAIGQERLVKAYDVLRAAPTAVALGSSRVNWGFDTQSPAWLQQNASLYNLGLGGGSPYIAYRYLQHVTSRHHLDLVILGLDFESFLRSGAAAPPPPDVGEFESFLAVTRDSKANKDRRWQYLISLDSLSDSATTLATNLLNISDWDFTSRGNWDPVSMQSRGRPSAYFNEADVVWSSRYSSSELQLNPQVISDVKAILDLCQSQQIEVILFISPVHANILEIFYISGYWGKFEDWKRELVALTSNYINTQGSSISLWDFSGYNSYSTETIIDKQPPHWFWESSHYTAALGDVISQRLFGKGDSSFGALIASENIELHLAAIREQQLRYHEERPTDSRRLRELYYTVLARSPRKNNASEVRDVR